MLLRCGSASILLGKVNMKTTRDRQNLVQASREWASRPADQRFWTLGELYAKSKQYAEESVIKTLALSKCRVVRLPGDDLGLAGPGGGVATFQHYSFGQLCGLAQAPAAYLRGLPALIASACLNNGLQDVKGEQLLMFHQNGGLQLRCVTSDSYSRIWNYEVAELALALEESEGWRVPPARPCGLENVPVRKATQEDVLRSRHKDLGINVGDDVSPAGLYASDHDLFIFQVNEDHPIDAGGGELLYRGVFWSNSEVGDARFRGTMFLYDTVCGNHIVWGAKVVAEINIVHKGNAQESFRMAMAQATQRALQPSSVDERRIQKAKVHVLGQSPNDVVKLVFNKGWGLSKRECEDAYVLASRHAEDHNTEPNTAWGYAAGITRLSQGKYQDKRDLMDRVAGKVLEMAF